MEFQKSKYKKREVVAIIEAYKAQYEKLIAELRARNNELSRQNRELTEEIERTRQREGLIIATLERAEKTSNQIIEQAQNQYSLEMQKLIDFNQKWDEYFNNLKEKYPAYPITQTAIDIKNKAQSLIEGGNAKEAIEHLDSLISKDEDNFDPKKKIGEYIASTSDNGFNLDDVLNPGELELEDLCKELGLMEENE